MGRNNLKQVGPHLSRDLLLVRRQWWFWFRENISFLDCEVREEEQVASLSFQFKREHSLSGENSCVPQYYTFSDGSNGSRYVKTNFFCNESFPNGRRKLEQPAMVGVCIPFQVSSRVPRPVRFLERTCGISCGRTMFLRL